MAGWGAAVTRVIDEDDDKWKQRNWWQMVQAKISLSDRDRQEHKRAMALSYCDQNQAAANDLLRVYIGPDPPVDFSFHILGALAGASNQRAIEDARTPTATSPI